MACIDCGETVSLKIPSYLEKYAPERCDRCRQKRYLVPSYPADSAGDPIKDQPVTPAFKVGADGMVHCKQVA